MDATNMKRLAAEAAVRLIEDGMVVGLGTGSTAYWAIHKIGEFVQGGLNVRAVATSESSESLAIRLGIPIVRLDDVERIDMTIDGADEIDPDLSLIKGGGGALLREKIVAAASRTFVVVADESKLVRRLGAFPLPVEIVPFGTRQTIAKLESLGCAAAVRLADGREFETDNGHWIADCRFGTIERPDELHRAINGIPGVVDNGLFLSMAHRVIIGRRDGSCKTMDRA
ncbi:ribose-5-phosphate isomerase RpiA [Paenibacillus sp. GYB003]|uniref:ribose-5-phosphate isomerase RpiA n=1 Tax=Paenibacillus sp. GYB003 TaxID=2994392 RepID=UPI002F967B12